MTVNFALSNTAVTSGVAFVDFDDLVYTVLKA